MFKGVNECYNCNTVVELKGCIDIPTNNKRAWGTSWGEKYFFIIKRVDNEDSQGISVIASTASYLVL